MDKRPLSRDELLQRLNEQMRFICKSGSAYDERDEFEEARRMATHLRILFHHKGSNSALLHTLGAWDDLLMLDSSCGGIQMGPPGPLLAVHGLIMWRQRQEGTGKIRREVVPEFDRGPFGSRLYKKIPLKDWWNGAVLTHGPSGTVFTRADFVLNIADKEGGAHVDPAIDEKWARLTRDHAFDPLYGVERGQLVPFLHMDMAVVGQIAYEAFSSLRDRPDIAPEGGKPWHVR